MAVRIHGDEDIPDFDKRVTIVPESSDRSVVIRALRDEIEHMHADRTLACSEPQECHGHAPSGRARPFIKVQDGCDRGCAYCIVPLVRGESRSEPLESIVEKVAQAAESGAAEVVLTGIDLSSWGRDMTEDTDLTSILRTLTEMETGMRFRLSSIEPDRLDDGILDLMAASSDICPHLHLPMQSGSDKVLKAMGREYRAVDFESIVLRAHEKVPGLVIGTDVLCGFPAEDHADFQETVSMIESLPITYMHVFPFSPRPGTAAFDMPETISHQEKTGRCSILREMSLERRRLHASGLVGRSIEVVDIRRREDGTIDSISADYTRVTRVGEQALRPGIRFLAHVTSSDEAHCISKPRSRSMQ